MARLRLRRLIVGLASITIAAIARREVWRRGAFSSHAFLAASSRLPNASPLGARSGFRVTLQLRRASGRKLWEQDDDESALMSGLDFGNEGDLDSDLMESVETMRKEDKRRRVHAEETGHLPVQELEAVEKLLGPGVEKQSGTYVDGTFGRGGHSKSILGRLSPTGKLFAFDVDPAAVAVGRKLEQQDSRFRIFHRPFAEMKEALEGVQVDGVLLDVGVSNNQVDNEEHGFRIRDDVALDLRMNIHEGIAAADWLLNVSVEELAWVIHANGEENPLEAERIAEAVLCRQQQLGRYSFAGELADVVKTVKGDTGYSGNKHNSAKLTFNAIRMFLNNEMEQLSSALSAAFGLLSPGGRCVIITFNPKERRVVREFTDAHEEPIPSLQTLLTPARLCELYPLVATDLPYSVRKLQSSASPRGSEFLSNPRAKSSKLITLIKSARRVPQVRSIEAPRPQELRFRKPELPAFRGGGG
ncbi:unnamed protein product [Polarella glacialis]|uniref:Uncharacterized protein n=1 Tax=Polarella glacialis TaxID=89957 RepID=A0A813GJT3_POLGL|nr:unnamed protein product [Polarella glacialis]